MDISAGLIAKGALGAGALAAAGGTGYRFRDEIGAYVKSKFFAPEEQVEKEDTETNKKITGLGIDEEGCKFKLSETGPKECDLDKVKLEKINFSIKDSGTLTVTDGASVGLKIEKITGDDMFPKDLKFTFTVKSPDSIEIKKADDQNAKITLKKEIGYDFKINSNNKLEKVWNATTIKEKIGLDCTNAEDCTIKTDGTVSILDGDEELTGVTSKEGSGKIKLQEDVNDYSQGIKISIESDSITLKGGTKKEASSTSDKTVESGTNFQIKFKDNKWFLSKLVAA